MILTELEAKEIDKDLDLTTVNALEKAIIGYSNNHFHRQGYRPEIEDIDGKRVYFDDINLFKVGDTIEVVGVQYLDGFYNVATVGDNYIEIDTDIVIPMKYHKGGGYLFQVIYPADVKQGAKEVLKHRKKKGSKSGIKSESVARYSVTYTDSSGTIFGVPSDMFEDFLMPYMKFR